MRYRRPYLCLFALALLCSPVTRAQAVSKRLPPAERPAGSSLKNDVAQDAVTPEAPFAARVVQYNDRDVIAINAKVRYTTLIILPKNEEILDFTCGDKEFWSSTARRISLTSNRPKPEPARTSIW